MFEVVVSEVGVAMSRKASRLDADTGLAPMSSLRVVSERLHQRTASDGHS